jgi:hypothetical protein
VSHVSERGERIVEERRKPAERSIPTPAPTVVRPVKPPRTPSKLEPTRRSNLKGIVVLFHLAAGAGLGIFKGTHKSPSRNTTPVPFPVQANDQEQRRRAAEVVQRLREQAAAKASFSNGQ